MAGSITVSEARQDFAEVVNRVAYGKERVTVVRRGRDLVAIVPMSDVLLLEAIEDELDLTQARAALAEAGATERIPWEGLRARLVR
jgi:prevent-host-death family protein